MALFSHQIRPQYNLIQSNISGETILDNIAGSNSLADMIEKNEDNPIYIIVPNKVSQAYLKNSPKDICLSQSYKFSKSIIYKVTLRKNTSCSSGPLIIRNGNSIVTSLVGDFVGSKKDQLLLVSCNRLSIRIEDLQILDFGKGFLKKIKYDETALGTWSPANLSNSNSIIMAGDFFDLGYSQVLFKSRDSKGDKIVIEDFSQEESPAIVRYSEAFGSNFTLMELFDLNNTQLAGDFLGLGYNQVLFTDHDLEGGKLAIVDFGKGKLHPFAEISGIGKDHIPISSLLDQGDLQFAGDFIGLGYSQVLFINCNHSKSENIKIVIVDFSKAPSSVEYIEKWGESTLFNGWFDANDTQLVGDFANLGHSQLLLVNHHHKGGKMMIADFSQGKPPASVEFIETWNNGIIFQGWLYINDTRFSGDFAGLGYDQILFLNSSLNEIRATIVDFKNGMPIPFHTSSVKARFIYHTPLLMQSKLYESKDSLVNNI